MKYFQLILCVSFFLFTAGVCAAHGAVDQGTKDVINGFIKEKAELTGTLDIYDKEIDAVRTLKLIKFYDEMEDVDAKTEVLAQLRDTRTGDMVDIVFVLVRQEETMSVDSFDIRAVKKNEMKKASDEERKGVSDEDIKTAITKYIERQTKFSGHLNLFDETESKLRKLKFVEMKENVRRMGTVSFITTHFEDIDSGDKLKVDVSVQVDDQGQPKVQNLLLKGMVK